MDDPNANWQEVLDAVHETNRLVQHLIAVELCLAGVSQEDIGKNLHVAKATVNEMVKGVKPRNAPRQKSQKK